MKATEQGPGTAVFASYFASVSRTRCLSRDMTPNDLVGAVLWLVSPASGFVTGQTLVVDGGGVFT